MNQPQQPICKGVDSKGELIWGFIPMPLWQQAMFPVHYCGDFMAFWIRHAFFNKSGHEGDPEAPSMELRSYKYGKPKPWQHSGD